MTDDLTERLGRIQDELAITRLLHAYGHALDYGDSAGWLALFEREAVLELRYRAGLEPRMIGTPEALPDGARYCGATALRSFAQSHSHAPDAYHKHLCTNALIAVDGDTASVESYFVRLDGADPGIRIVAAGRYRDQLRRQRDGRWCFVHRVAEIEQQTLG